MTEWSHNAPSPLARWGDTLRAAKRRRRRLRLGAAAIGGIAVALAVTIMLPPRPLLVWNASASAPLGLYWVSGRRVLARDDMVIARLAPPWRELAARRHYLPANVPLVKRVAAASGDTVCAIDRAIFINGTRIADRRRRDPSGRSLPWWQGCITLRHGAALLLMADKPTSFDGRYFGPTSARDIVGEAHPAWTW